MPSKPLLIEDDNLSRAWVRVFQELATPGVDALAPLVLTVHLAEDGRPLIVPGVGERIDAALRDRGVPTSQTTASLIFPSFWNPSRPRSELYDRYQRILPRIRKDRLNRDGVYFERLIAFEAEGTRRNQLEYIISTYAGGNHRKSALQAAVLNPARDQTNQRQRGFPCLQQVSFLPDPDEGLGVTGYYATQYIVDRAYGNYLGLCQLGRFVAHELQQRCSRMACVAATARLGDRWTKSWARAQLPELIEALDEGGVPLTAGAATAGVHP
jgi:hypothetical protein